MIKCGCARPGTQAKSGSGSEPGRSKITIVRNVAAAACLAATIVGSAAGCGRQPNTATSSVAKQELGVLAVSYTRDVFSKHASAAAELVEPASRSQFQVLADIISQQHVSERNLAVGSVEADVNSAVVVITGTLCSSSSGTTASNPGESGCITNADRNSTSPIFRVSLERSARGTWYVYFPAPSAATPAVTAMP